MSKEGGGSGDKSGSKHANNEADTTNEHEEVSHVGMCLIFIYLLLYDEKGDTYKKSK